jgi:hypothetical protein
MSIETCREILLSPALTSQWFEDLQRNTVLFKFNIERFEGLKRNTVLSNFNCFASTRVDPRN